MHLFLNSQYALRNEKGCSYIVTLNVTIDKRVSDLNHGAVLTLPPILGYILSSVDNCDLEEAVGMLADKIRVNSDILRTFLYKLIDNPVAKSLRYGDNTFKFPPYLLTVSKTEIKAKISTERDADIYDKYCPKRPSVPLSLNFMITTSCHTNCIYCYADRCRKDDLAVDEILKVIDDCYRAGVVNLALTGGDVLVYKDWKRILERAYVYNYAPLISTKRPLRREDVIYLKEIGVKRIQISLDSVCPDELSKMLKVNYSYANEMMNTFHYCNEIGLEVDVRTVLTKMNVAEQSLNNLFLFLESMACVTSWVLTPAFVSAFKEDYESYQADEQQLIDAFRLTKNKKTHLLIYHNKMSEKRYSQKHFSSVNEFIQNNQTCYANSYAMSIISNGKVTVCEMLYENEDFLLGDINKQNIAEIWNSSEALTLYSYKQEFIKRKENNSCCSCSVYEKCKTGLGKKVCYVDVTKIYGNRLYEYPDPRCPRALEYDRKLFV